MDKKYEVAYISNEYGNIKKEKTQTPEIKYVFIEHQKHVLVQELRQTPSIIIAKMFNSLHFEMNESILDIIFKVKYAFNNADYLILLEKTPPTVISDGDPTYPAKMGYHCFIEFGVIAIKGDWVPDNTYANSEYLQHFIDEQHKNVQGRINIANAEIPKFKFY